MPPGYERRTSPAYDVAVRVEHGPWLRSLLPLFEVVWATTWGDSANAVFGTIHGLPTLPAIALARDLPRDGTRKLAAVAAYAGGRPLAWVDDEIYEVAEAWARLRDAPALLRRTRASIGLTRDDVDALMTFASGLQSRQSP